MESLRQEIRELYARRERGDVRERDFQRQLAERSVDLYRHAARRLMQPDEPILAEHHVVHAHLKLAESVLREPDQEPISLFASDRQLVRVRGILAPQRPVTCDERDETRVDALAYDNVRAVLPVRSLRKSELVAGLIIAAVALVFRSHLAVTGPILLLLGLAGTLHALLLPTRWVEVIPKGSAPVEPFAIAGLRRRSAKDLLRVIQTRTKATSRTDGSEPGGRS